MNHSRRGFLGLISAGVAAALDQDELLWTPKRLISIPNPPKVRFSEWDLHSPGAKLLHLMSLDVTINGTRNRHIIDGEALMKGPVDIGGITVTARNANNILGFEMRFSSGEFRLHNYQVDYTNVQFEKKFPS